jgi:hypothetical protein
MESLVYLMERPAIFYMFTTKSESYYIISAIVVLCTTHIQVAPKRKYLVSSINFTPKKKKEKKKVKHV